MIKRKTDLFAAAVMFVTDIVLLLIAGAFVFEAVSLAGMGHYVLAVPYVIGSLAAVVLVWFF